MQRMRWMALLLAGMTFSVSACGSSEADPESEASPPQASASSSAPSLPAVKHMSASERTGYLAALRKIDPGLVANEERAVGRGENTCMDIRSGMKGGALVTRVSQRFTGGNATVDAAKARKVIAAVKRWC